MKNLLLIVLLSFVSCDWARAQNIPIQIAVGQLNMASNPLLITKDLKSEERDKFSKPTDDKILITLTGAIPAGKSYTLNDVAMDANQSFDITKTVRKAITDHNEKRSFIFKQIDAANPSPGAKCGSIDVTWTTIPTTIVKETAEKDATQAAEQNRKKIVDQFKRNISFKNPYDNKANQIDLYFDENGRILNHLPVNVDQNDIFYMHIVCVKGDEEKYSVNVTEGEFAPVDLAIRPFDKVSSTVGQDADEVSETTVAKEYTAVALQSGPYTSDDFKFQISYDSSFNKIRNGPEYSIKINKLYHVGVGVSIVSTSLENPDYKTFVKAPGDTTIKAFNGGRRTLFTFNAIWYWSVLHQKPKGSVIPNGRDVLKDEPTFSLSRVFPTVGVSLDSKFKENFFVGAVYEFARGGSLTAGLHYGRVSRLADDKFILGQTAFSGTDDDIKLNESYKCGFYLGLTLDTRILNLLFSKGQ